MRHVGERVIIMAGWGSFDRARGVVTQIEPHVKVLLDGERMPMRFDDYVLIPEEGDSSLHLGGAE